MEAFLSKLYSYEYFGIYLMISIIVLIALFIIILFFGKKDQKKRELEETKRLQQLGELGFKEESEAQPVEVVLEPNLENNEVKLENNLENDTIIMPSIESTFNEPTMDEIPEPVLPVQEEVTMNEEVETPEIVNLNENTVEENVNPVLEPLEEKPLMVEDNFAASFEEPIVTEVPEFNFDEIVKNVEEVKEEPVISEPVYNKGPEIFSSVYTPEIKEELPKVDIPPVVETFEQVETIEPVKEISSSDDEMDFELPTLKKEVVEEEKEEVVEQEDNIEVPELKDYDLDNLSGETYRINN